MRRRVPLLLALLAAALPGALAVAAWAKPAGRHTVAECARLEVKSPGFRGSRLAATVFCLRPSSIRTTASITWTTCPTTPIDEPCAEGVVSVAFRSTAPGFGRGTNQAPGSWGGEDYPGAGMFSLPGVGTYRCKAADIDRQVGKTVIRSYAKTLPLRDSAAGFAAVGANIEVATTVHPGMMGPWGVAAGVRLGQPGACQVFGLPIGADAVRAVWPGKIVSARSLSGFSTTVQSAGRLKRSFPVPLGEGLGPGVKIDEAVRWSSSVSIVSALRVP